MVVQRKDILCESPLLEREEEGRTWQVVNLPSANAFSIYNPQEQSPVVQDRYEKFTAPLPATLALRAAGLLLPEIVQQYVALPAEQQQIEKAYRTLQLEHPLFAARSIALAFDQGLFKKIATNNYNLRVFKQIHIQALQAILKGAHGPLVEEYVQQAKEEYANPDLAMLVADVYAQGGLSPVRADSDIQHFEGSLRTKPWKKLNFLHSLEASEVKNEVIIEHANHEKRNSPIITRAADGSDSIAWAGGHYRLKLPREIRRPRFFKSYLRMLFDADAPSISRTDSISQVLVRTHIKQSRKELGVPGRRGADIKTLFDRRWLTAPVHPAGPSRTLTAEERLVLDELPTGATEVQITKRLAMDKSNVTNTVRALRNIFGVDTTQGLIMNAYGCGLLEAIELEDKDQRESA